jgi:hypothetical protein
MELHQLNLNDDITNPRPLLISRKKKVHFVNFNWSGKNREPQLQYYDSESMEAENWQPDDFNIIVLGPRKCIGHFQSEQYHPCIRHRRVSEFPQCYKCAPSSIPILRCIFEPRCYGDRCTKGICDKPHIVYLAFYDTLPKVGMTSYDRLYTRIVEQGADAVSIIAGVSNRYSARALERQVSKILQLKENYDPEIILRTLTQRLHKKEIEEKFSLIATSLKDRFQLKCSELDFIDNYTLDGPLRSTPVLKSTVGMHRGKLIGIKGKFLIYESKGLNALKLNDMLGLYMMIGEA